MKSLNKLLNTVKTVQLSLALAFTAFALPAAAQVDVSAVSSATSDAITAVGTVGGLMIGVAAAILVWRVIIPMVKRG